MVGGNVEGMLSCDSWWLGCGKKEANKGPGGY